MRKEAGGSGRPISANPQIKPNKQEDHPPHDAERSHIILRIKIKVVNANKIILEIVNVSVGDEEVFEAHGKV